MKKMAMAGAEGQMDEDGNPIPQEAALAIQHQPVDDRILQQCFEPYLGDDIVNVKRSLRKMLYNWLWSGPVKGISRKELSRNFTRKN
jgi:hypothetical protein